MSRRKAFVSEERGNFATSFGLLASVFAVGVALAMQIAGLHNSKSSLQDVVDAAAMATAREASLSNFGDVTAQGIAENFVLSNLTSRMRDPRVETSIELGSVAKHTPTEITVAATVHVEHPLWSRGGNMVDIEASATVRATSAGKICVVVLQSKGAKAVDLREGAALNAPDCAVYSNSIDNKGMASKDGALLDSMFSCTAGGYEGNSYNYGSLPLTDCPQTGDPLVDRDPPAVGSCLSGLTGKVLSSGVHTLTPGTYCEGLTIKGSASVTMLPGEYVFKDGSLMVEDDATLAGENVGMYFTGEKAGMEFFPGTTIDLTAPKEGDLAGVLIYQDRAAAEDTDEEVDSGKEGDFVIGSNNARQLLGTIYIPRSTLVVKGAALTADKSAYTAIVARKLKMKESPNLVLNTNYSSTDVPVPAGLGPVPAKVWMAK